MISILRLKINPNIMKKNTLSILLLLVISFFFNQAVAQDGYTLTLVSNGYSGGTYNFTVQAVPLATSTSVANPTVQSYGYTVLIPDGAAYTLAYASSIGSASMTDTPIPEVNVNALSGGAYAGHKGFLITDTLAAPIALGSTPASLTPVDIMTLSVGGDPASGEIRLIANNSTFATAGGGSLDAYLFADMLGGTSYANQIAGNPLSGLSGTENYSFSVLATNGVELVSNKFSLYPNPSSDNFSVAGLKAEANVSIYSVSGKKVLSVEDYTGDAINVSALTSGLYLVSIESETSKEVKRLVIK